MQARKKINKEYFGFSQFNYNYITHSSILINNMGCSSSNTIIPVPKQINNQVSIQPSDHRLTPIQILTNHSIVLQNKPKPSFSSISNHPLPTPQPSKHQMPIKTTQIISIEEKKQISHIAMNQKQNIHQITTPIPDSTTKDIKDIPKNSKGKKGKKINQLMPFQKQLKRLYGV